MSSSVLVSATPDRVWDVVTRANRWSDWADVCSEVWNAPTGPDEWKPGHRFGFRLNFGMRTVPFNVQVRVVESGDRTVRPSFRFVEWDSTKFTITAVRTISIDSESGDRGCLVTDSKHFSSPVLPIAPFYPRWLITRMTESWLQDLKTEAESTR